VNIVHQYLIYLSTSPLSCSHCTLGNPKSHFQQYYSYVILIIYVIRELTKCTRNSGYRLQVRWANLPAVDVNFISI